MEYRRFGNKLVIRMDRGEEIVETLRQLCADNGVKLGSVTGIGAVDSATVGLFETGPKQYTSTTLTGDHEITALAGNISTMDGKVYLHIHATLADISHKAFGGHLNAAIVSGTCEMIVDIIEGEIDREFSQEIGLNLIKFR